MVSRSSIERIARLEKELAEAKSETPNLSDLIEQDESTTIDKCIKLINDLEKRTGRPVSFHINQEPTKAMAIICGRAKLVGSDDNVHLTPLMKELGYQVGKYYSFQSVDKFCGWAFEHIKSGWASGNRKRNE